MLNRKIVLEGTNNTRDLGDYSSIVNINNKRIHRGKLFRSDKLSKLTDNDIEKIKELNIRYIIDFRSETERNHSPNIIIDGITYINLPIDASNDMNEIKDVVNGTSNKPIKQFLIDINKDFILKYHSIFLKFIAIILEKKEPILFHCTAGKDRTGFASALILYLLDFSKTDIYQEYMYTNECTKDGLEDILIYISSLLNIDVDKAKLLIPLLGVDREFLDSAFTTAIDEHGSFDNFIFNTLGVTMEMKEDLKKYLLY